MEINVLQELREPIGSSSEFDIDERDISFDHLDVEHLAGSAFLLRTDRGLLVHFRASGRARTPCSRCLTEIDLPIELDFEEEYIPRVDANTGAPVRLQASDSEDAFRIDPHFTLDLREAVRQYILMSEPAKPLCRSECAGICPTCGYDMNLGPCQCAPEVDERWQALAGLREREQGGG